MFTAAPNPPLPFPPFPNPLPKKILLTGFRLFVSKFTWIFLSKPTHIFYPIPTPFRHEKQKKKKEKKNSQSSPDLLKSQEAANEIYICYISSLIQALSYSEFKN